MAPRAKGIPKNAPFPNKPLETLIEEAKERRKIWLQQRGEHAGINDQSINEDEIVSKVNMMMPRSKCAAASSSNSSPSNSYIPPRPKTSPIVKPKEIPPRHREEPAQRQTAGEGLHTGRQARSAGDRSHP